MQGRRLSLSTVWIMGSRHAFLYAAGLTLAGCVGGAHTSPIPRRIRAEPVLDGGGDSPPPLCTSPGQTGCIDPSSGLFVIGSVQARLGPRSFQTGWSVGGSGDNPDYLGAVFNYADRIDLCVQHQQEALIGVAFAMATYIQANASRFVSAGSDIRTYVGVYLAGGATAIELVGAVAAVFTVGEWLVLLGAIGFTAYEVATLINCVASGK